MYTDWFHLERLPFRLRPDPEFLYLNGNSQRVRDHLCATALRQSGLVLLLGEAGVGKTTMLHVLAQDLAPRREVARLQLAGLTPQEAFGSLAAQFGIEAPDAGAATDLARFARYFAETSGSGKPSVILADEAHQLPDATLRDLLSLCKLKPSPLLVLAGEGILEARLAGAGLRSGPGRPVVFSLERLAEEQVRHYVTHRLSIAGAQGALMDPDAFAEIVRYTGGTPKLINALCDCAMTLAETHSSPRVTAGEIRDAARAMKWVEFEAAVAAPGDTPSDLDAPPPLRLQVRFNGIVVDQLPLRPGRVVIGRGDEADLKLPSSVVSRAHCRIVTTGEQSIIEDLGSTNGIIVNGKRLRVHRLRASDSVMVGDHELLCLAEGDAGA